MARVTVEDCIDKVENRFDLVLLASHRARTISSGSQITVDRDNDKNPVVALREIAEADQTPDLAVAKPLIEVEAPAHLTLDRRKWEEILRRVSARFVAAPSVSQSSVRFRALSSTYRLVNSEGTII